MARFTDGDYQLTGQLLEVPHIGPKTIDKLKANGIKTTYQLLGHFLTLNRNKEQFVQFLAMVGTPELHRDKLAEAIRKRVTEIGVKITVQVPDNIDGKPVSSKLDDIKADNIKGMRFNGDLRHDFPGCGFGKATDKKKNESVVNLARNGIATTDQLFGELLQHLNEPNPTTKQVVAFWKTLGAKGAAAGYKTTIIEAMKLKLDIGIDNCAKLPMAGITEDDNEEPATEQTQRTMRRRPETSPGRGPRPPAPPAPPPAAPKKPLLSCGAKFGLVVVAIAVGYVALIGSAERTAALPAPESSWSGLLGSSADDKSAGTWI